jgi:type VI secretion system secreted protein Hcp
MRHARSALLLAATFSLVGSVGAWTEPVPGTDGDPPFERAPALDEILDALGIDALAVDMFMKIEGIEGESTARGGHDAWIEIDSFGWGESRPQGGTGQSRRRSSVTFSDVSVVKKVDGSSPSLYLACASGTHYPAAELVVRKAGSGDFYFRIRLDDVRVSSVSVSASAEHAEPMEEVGLTYGKIRWEYSPQGDKAPGGNVERSWDLMANKPG